MRFVINEIRPNVFTWIPTCLQGIINSSFWGMTLVGCLIHLRSPCEHKPETSLRTLHLPPSDAPPAQMPSVRKFSSSWDTFSRKTPRYFLPVQYSESTDAKLCRFVEHHSLPLGAYGLWIWPVTSADSLYAFCLKENKRRDLLVCPERWCCVLSLSTYQVPTQFTTGYLPSVRCQLFISNISPRSSLRYERYLKEVNLSA